MTSVTDGAVESISATATPDGALPTGVVAITVFAVLITDTVFELKLVA